MIKLINYQKYASREVFISKTMIHSMQREDDMTHIIMEGGCSYTVKETPEEILAMPDIEEANKVIDWEQRRFKVSSNVINRLISAPYFLAAAKDNPIESLVSISIRVADALIDVLKKGQDND